MGRKQEEGAVRASQPSPWLECWKEKVKMVYEQAPLQKCVVPCVKSGSDFHITGSIQELLKAFDQGCGKV
jgi:hypothetical protein